MLMQGWHLHDFWPRFCRGKSCHFVCFVVAACCLCDICCLPAGDLQNGEQCPGSPVYTHAPPRAPLSRISRELLLNCSWTAREHVLNYSWTWRVLFVNYPWQFVTVVALRALSSTGTHPPASSRRVHEQFAHSLRPGREILSWPKFWTFQNSCPDMTRSPDGFTHTSRQFTTSLRTGTTWVVPMRATESCKCQPCFRVYLPYNKLASLTLS